MNRSTRLASWLVVLLGALVTMGTSRAPGPSQELRGTFTRELSIGESAHVTLRIPEPAMDFVRENPGGTTLAVSTSAGSFLVVPDDSRDVPTDVPAAMEGMPQTRALELSCSATGPCVLGFTLSGPASGSAAQIEMRVSVVAFTDAQFPAGSIITIVED